MNTQNKTDRKKNQRQDSGHRQAVAKKQTSHEQERPETRLTR